MTYQVGQLSYSLYTPGNDPGDLADNSVTNHIVGAPANEQIFPGRGVMLHTDGISVKQMQGTRADTTTAVALYGVALNASYQREGVGQQNDSATNGGAAWAAGDFIPILRRGAMFGEWKGTTIPANGTLNMYQSSTLAADRGKFTDAAAATTAGSEIGPVGKYVATRPPALAGTGNIVLISVNLPGAP